MTDPLDPSLDWINAELDALDAASLMRVPAVVDSPPGPEITIGGERLILACSNNYLGLAADERIIEGAQQAAGAWGGGAGASPLVSGLSRLQRDLEGRLAELKSSEDAVVFSSGYLANVGVIQALVGGGDAVFSDELNHASIIDGCRLSRADVVVYRHCDYEHLGHLLSTSSYRRALVVTDTVFSMDGDLAGLVEFVEVARHHGAMTMVDEAHATGVIGRGGAGGLAALGLDGEVDAVVGTLSKALASAGGFVAGSKTLCKWVRNRARSQIFDTAPAPAALGAAMAALDVVAGEPWRRERIGILRERVVAGLTELGYEVPATHAAVIPVMVGESERAMALAAEVRAHGVFAPAIRPPTVAPGSARIRLSVMATMSDTHADSIVGAFAAAATPPSAEVAADARDLDGG